MKTCSKCKIEKEFSEFHKNKYSKDGHKSRCKSCRSIEEKLYYKDANILYKVNERRKTNKSYLENNKKYREKNIEKLKEVKKEWSKSDSGKKSKKKYYEKNSDSLKEKSKINRKNKRDFYREKEKYRRNTPEYKENMKFYKKKHRIQNPHIYAWRSLLTNTLKRLNTKKSGKTIDILGYSANELKTHLESLFKEGMTWYNYGEWHIDHIRPVSKFDKNADVKEVNALENLQPLWAKENLSKYNHYNN